MSLHSKVTDEPLIMIHMGPYCRPASLVVVDGLLKIKESLSDCTVRKTQFFAVIKMTRHQLYRDQKFADQFCF